VRRLGDTRTETQALDALVADLVAEGTPPDLR